MRPLPEAPPPESAGIPPGRSLSMPPSCDEAMSFAGRAKPENLQP